jgi:hypothetical protein
MTKVSALALLCLCFAGLAMATVTANGQEAVWVALVKANDAPPTENLHLEKLRPRLRAVFGFEQYHLLHEAHVATGERYGQWVLPRRDFYIKLEPLADAGIHYELYRDKVLLVDGKAYLTSARPLFIAGPECSDGRLIFLLQRVPVPVPMP